MLVLLDSYTPDLKDNHKSQSNQLHSQVRISKLSYEIAILIKASVFHKPTKPVQKTISSLSATGFIAQTVDHFWDCPVFRGEN